MVNLRLSFFEVFNSNFHTLKVLIQLSMKLIIYYRKYSSNVFQNSLILNSSFQENAKTKVYALEDSLGVDASTSD